VVEKGPPIVFAGRRPLEFEGDSVTADNRMGARMAVEHLISKRHTRIAIITGPSSLSLNRDRRESWKQTLRKAGLAVDKELALDSDWSPESGYRQTCRLLAMENRPTAIFTSSLLLLTGSLRAIKESGLRCPGQVELMCADNWEWLDVFDPPISAIMQPSYEMGRAAAELLFRRIAEPDGKHEAIVLKPSLMSRSV
jgi:DNA-binding LacI/PurR family transcriptional regulator